MLSVAIVARSGVTKVHLRADNAGPHTVGSSTGKAFTSASMGRETAGLAGFIGKNPQNDGLRDMDERLAIQAGGAPSGDIDAGCARTGLDAIGAE